MVNKANIFVIDNTREEFEVGITSLHLDGATWHHYVIHDDEQRDVKLENIYKRLIREDPMKFLII